MSITYTHTQSTPSIAWTIVHNLNCAPVGDVVENDGGVYRKVLPLSVKHIDLNTLLVEFSVATAGSCRLIGSYSYDPLVPPGTIDPGANVSGVPPQEGIGFFAAAASSEAPPAATIMTGDRTFSGTPGAFEFFDDFDGTESLSGHAVSTWTDSASHPNPGSPYTWFDNDADTVSGGAAQIANGHTTANVSSTDEYDSPNGIYMEAVYNATSQNTNFLMGLNLGYTNISIVAGGLDGGYEDHIRMDASGFNGGVKEDGSLLDPTENDTLMGIFSHSFTLDRYYSETSGDWRNKVLRLELTESLLTLYADGDIILQKVPRFNVQLFASATYQYSSAYSNLAVFPAGSGDIEVEYVKIGSL